jgi:serine/threonine protein kinase
VSADWVHSRFLLTRRLGGGAHGEAHLARDETTGDEVVVKLLLPDQAQRTHTTERFRREIVALESLCHPNIVKLVAHGRCPDRGQPYYVMCYTPGVELREVLREHKRLPPVRVRRIMVQLLSALEHAHEHGILHRDLKPENVLLGNVGTPEEQVFLIDFGLAKLEQGGQRTIEDLTRGRVLGTPIYMSPEQCMGESAVANSDVYSVGCLLMELLSGTPPFVRKDGTSVVALLAKHVGAAPPLLRDRLPDVAPSLSKLVSRCLEKAPESRPSAKRVRVALDLILGGNERRPTAFVRRPVRIVTKVAVGGELDGLPILESVRSGDFLDVYQTRLPDGRSAELEVLANPRRGEDRQRFSHELRLLRALTHPAIPGLFRGSEEGDSPFRVLKPVSGQSLESLLAARGRLSAEEVLYILRQVVPALDHAHCRGVVHCHLGPRWVRLQDDGRVFLLGLGYEPDPAPQLLYSAPEYEGGRGEVSPLVDVYSLGALVYHLLTGAPPPADPEAADLSRLASGLAPDAVAAVMRCLELEVGSRFGSTGRFLGAFELATATTQRFEPRPLTSSPSETASAFALGVLTGPRAGQVIPLPTEGEFELGLTSGLGVGPDEGVAALHAKVHLGETPSLEALSIKGTWIEERRLQPGERVPLSAGSRVRLGPATLLLFNELLALQTDPGRGWRCRRTDSRASTFRITRPTVLGRSPTAGIQVVPETDLRVSGQHCRLSACLGVVVLEDLGSTNGTFVAGQRVRAAALHDGQSFTLGGTDGPRLVLARRSGGPTRNLGSSTEVLAVGGDALRLKLDVALGESRRRLFLFAGQRLRFGRNRANPKYPRENDVMLRAFPASPDEDPSLVLARTRRISGHHGSFLVTQDGLAVCDDGSTSGTELDGVELRAHEPVPLQSSFLMRIPASIRLRGEVVLRTGERRFPTGIAVPAQHPVAALRLERSGDEDQHTYVLLLDELSLGSGADDGCWLPEELGVCSRHAALGLRRGRFVITALEGEVKVGGRSLSSGETASLEPGREFRVGEVTLCTSVIEDSDMKWAGR